MRLVLGVERLPAAALYGLVAVLVAEAATVDVLTGLGERGALLYLLPVSIASYHRSARFGVAVSIVSAAVWLWVDVARAAPPLAATFWVWRAATRLVLFLIVAALLVALRRAFEDQKALASTDALTGATNVRRFHEMADAELARLRRYGHPVTLALFDVDDFKTVNDTLGHATGDEVLCAIVTALRSVTREVDVVARLGGDEFAMLFPETGPEQARLAVGKIRSDLATTMEGRGWPVSFSIGVVTCLDPRAPADRLLREADRLAYEVKNSGKDGARFDVIAKPAGA
jgi:diguanylate cyclase (GGDEF)-like protein